MMEHYNQEYNVFSIHRIMENEDEFQLQLDLAFREHDLLKHYQFHHDNKHHEQRLVMKSKNKIDYKKKIDFISKSFTLNVFTAE
jgi:hypothetical protein